MKNLKIDFNQKDVSKSFLSKYILPQFGSQPEYNIKSGLPGKQPSYIDSTGKAKAIAWKQYQHFYNFSEADRDRLNATWQSHPDSGVSTLLGFNGRFWIHGVDFDKKNFDDNFDEIISNLLDKHPILNACHRFSTPSGGLRILFATKSQLVGFKSNSGFTIDGFDAKCGEILSNNGGHTLMPGANGYKWIYGPNQITFIEDYDEIFKPSKSRKKYKQRSNVQRQDWDEYLANFKFNSDLFPLELAIASSHRDALKNGVGEGDRNNSTFKLAVDLFGTYEFLNENNQAILGDPEAIIHEFADKCLPPIEPEELFQIIKSARQHDGTENHKSALTPEQIKACVASYFYKQDNKVVPIRPNFSNLENDIDKVIEDDLGRSQLKARLLEIANFYKIPPKEANDLYQSKLADIDWSNRSNDSKNEIEEFLGIQDRVPRLNDYLDKSIATPLSKLCILMGISPLIALTNFITISATLIPLSTRLCLISKNNFYVNPILYSCIVAPSGSNKTGSIRLFLNPLRSLQNEENKRYKSKMDEYKSALKAFKKDKTGEIEEPEEPDPPREYYINDATTEAIAKIQNNQEDKGFLGYFDELAGLLGQANKYRNGKGNDIEKLLSGRDGDGIKINRASGTRIDCSHSGYSILGGIQPEILKRIMDDFSDANGFWARFIFASQDLMKCEYPEDNASIDIAPFLEQTYKNLEMISDRTFYLDDIANEYYKKWYLWVENEKFKESNPSMRSVISKSKRTVGEIALIFHCLDAAIAGVMPEDKVSGATMQKAIALFYRHYLPTIKMIKADGDEESSQSVAYTKIIKLSERKGWITPRDIKLNIWEYRKKSSDQLRNYFNELVKLGYGMIDGKGVKTRWRCSPKNNPPSPSTPPSPPTPPSPSTPPSPPITDGLVNNKTHSSSTSSDSDSKSNFLGVNNENQDISIKVEVLEQKTNDTYLDLFAPQTLQLEEWKPSNQIVDYTQAKKLYLDIETIGGLDPKEGRIISIGLMLDGQDAKLIAHESEKQILTQAIAFIKNNSPCIIIGHNIHNFDIPYITNRCLINGVSNPFRKSNKPSVITSSSVNGKPIEVTQWFMQGNEIIDTFIQAGIYDKSASVLPNYRLKDVAIALKVRDEKRLELDHNEIASHWANGDIDPILEYLKYDLEDTKGLADFFLPVVWYQKFIVPELSLQSLSIASPALKWEKMAESFYPDYLPIPDQKIPFEGGITKVNPGVYKNAFKIDVSSMYPSIILRYELASRKDKDKQLLRVMKYLVTQRLELKAKFKQTGDRIYDQQQNALKILINGGYGFFGTGGYAFNDMGVATKVTAYGRKILNLMMDSLIDAGCTIIEADTDGIIACGGNDTPLGLTNYVQSKLPDGINIDLDFENTHIYVPKRKSYLLFNGEKIKRVGIFRKRDKAQYELDFPVEFVKRYLEVGENAAIAYYEELKSAIAKGDYNIEFLKITKKIPASDKSLTNAGLGDVGDKVSYYITEQIRYSDRTGKQLKSIKLPATSGNYWASYYCDRVDKIFAEISNLINRNRS